jgi:hypothetical protein
MRGPAFVRNTPPPQSPRPVVRVNDCCRNRRATQCVQPDMDDDERAAIRADGHDPDHPAVFHALDQVKRTLRLYRHLAWTFTVDDLDGHHLPR